MFAREVILKNDIHQPLCWLRNPKICFIFLQINGIDDLYDIRAKIGPSVLL